jgi:bacteriorhodopsin
LCEGANILHPDYEAIFYGLLDVITMPLFGVAVISMLPEQSENTDIDSS